MLVMSDEPGPPTLAGAGRFLRLPQGLTAGHGRSKVKAMSADPSPGTPERRSTLRLVFPLERCPRLETVGRTYPVVDATPVGLRLRLDGADRFDDGMTLSGTLRLPGVDEPSAVSGHVSWVGPTELGLALDLRALSPEVLTRALAYQQMGSAG